MRKIVTLLILLVLVCGAEAQTNKILSIKAELNRGYGGYPEGTPVIVRGVKEMKIRREKTLAIVAEIEEKQIPIPSDSKKVLTLQPETPTEFWQSVCIQHNIYEYFEKKGYRTKLRRELEIESHDYLDRLDRISYYDAYVTDYVQGVFARVAPNRIDPRRPEQLSVRVVQSPDPDAYMVPNGVLVVSTGLLSTLDSEEELTAIMANEIAHYILDHQVINVVKAENRSKRAAVFGTVLAGVAEFSRDIAWYDNNKKAAAVSVAASIGSIATLASIQAVNRLGIKYNEEQELIADQVVLNMLRFKGIDPDALASALGKVKRFYQFQNQCRKLVRYGSCSMLDDRLAKLNRNANLHNHEYHKITADVVTFNAGMYQDDRRYRTAELLTRKNINSGVASEHDYVINVQARMGTRDTPESNEECLKEIRHAKSLSQTPNLDIYKTEALLLIRLNRQAEASDTLKEYLNLLVKYREQPEGKDDTEWISQEITWARNTLSKISSI